LEKIKTNDFDGTKLSLELCYKNQIGIREKFSQCIRR